MSTEGKSFGFDKPRKFVHPIAFKVDDEGKEKLEACFKLLRVRGKRTSDMMRDFIKKVHKQIQEYEELGLENTKLKREVTKLSKLTEEQNLAITQTLVKLGKEETKVEPAKPSKPQSIKSEPVKPSEAVPKHEADKPKAAECVRGIKTPQWDIACRNCRTMHRLDYVKCSARQKPKIEGQLPLKRW